MRLILSRKGFDSSTGRVASPILPDGRMVSLPIPERDAGLTYGDLAWRGAPLAPLVEQLTRGRIPAHFGVHLDPDLDAGSLSRASGWRPAFGQAGAAQSVLARAGVGRGDLFLFFGWFRPCEAHADGLRFARAAPDLHVLFGWLQVGEVLTPPRDAIPAWAARHPHVLRPERQGNALYVASERLRLGGVDTGLPGAGGFPRYDDALRLTAPGERLRSRWRLPGWMLPPDDVPALGYHDDPARWRRDGEHVRLDAVARGQEFVLDVTAVPEAASWARELIARHGAERDEQRKERP